MRFLSAHQALADIVTFVGYVRDTYAVPTTAKWVTFGGSYPGMMSGWARYNFPSLIHASVASSAPVQAQLNFEGYNGVVADR